jgi:predicted nucleotidyltransferase
MKEEGPTVRDRLLDAALWFVQAVVRLQGVNRIALVGSIVTERRSPKDVDLLVYVTNGTDLTTLAALGRRLMGRLQSQSRGADVFLADERGQYLGRTCLWKVCRPGIRVRCDALNCGRRPYLHDDLNTVCLDDALVATPPVELWPVVVRRVKLPADVERFLARLGEPHNYSVHPTPGAPSLSAPGS